MKLLKPINSLKKTVQGTYKKLTNVQKLNLGNSLNPKKTVTKTGEKLKFIDNKIKHDKNDGNTHKKKSNQMILRKTKPIKTIP